MAQKCGFQNRTRPWTCQHEVNHPPCWQHRQSTFSLFSPRLSPGGSQPTEVAATFLADVLTEGVMPTIADRVTNRVVDYLGWSGAHRFRRQKRNWIGVDCRLLAQTARAVLDLKEATHKLVSEAVDRLLPRDIPRFHRTLVKKISEKVPLPIIDAKLEAIARGLQVIGIWMCAVQNLPVERCACLRMLGPQLAKEQVKRYIEDLLEATERDLQEGGGLN